MDFERQAVEEAKSDSTYPKTQGKKRKLLKKQIRELQGAKPFGQSLCSAAINLHINDSILKE